TIDFRPDSKWLLAAGGKQATLWKADSGQEVGTIPFTNAQAVRFAADSRHVIASSDAGLFDCALSFHESGDPSHVDVGAVHRMNSVLVSDGLGTMDLSLDRTIAAVIRSDSVLLLPLTAKHAPGLRAIRLGTYYPKAALHPTGAWLATAKTGAGEPRVVEPKPSSATLPATDETVTGGAHANELHLWNLSEETPVRFVIPFAEHFAFSPDGQWLATCSGGEFQFHRVGVWTNRAFAIPRKLTSDQHAPV